MHDGNPNQFRRPFLPRFIPRERRNNDIQRERKENEDKRIQPPFQNNLLNEEGEVEDIEYEDFDQDINHIKDELYESYLTKDQYLNAEILEDYSHDDIYQTETKKSYNLRSRVKQVVRNPKKNQWLNRTLIFHQKRNRIRSLARLRLQSWRKQRWIIKVLILKMS